MWVFMDVLQYLTHDVDTIKKKCTFNAWGGGGVRIYLEQNSRLQQMPCTCNHILAPNLTCKPRAIAFEGCFSHCRPLQC